MALRPALITLGKFELGVGDAIASQLPTQKARALVAFLVTHRGRDVSRERLLELFWNDFEPQRAREGLRTALSSVRHALRSTQNDPAEILFTNKSVIRWIESTDFDVERFVEFAARDDPTNLDAALTLYNGDFLEGNYEEWAVGERERVAGAYEVVLGKVVAQSKNPRVARLLLERNPYDENAYAVLIEEQLDSNRYAAAAELLRRCRAALEQVGSEPSSAFEKRFAAVTASIGTTDPKIPGARRE